LGHYHWLVLLLPIDDGGTNGDVLSVLCHKSYTKSSGHACVVVDNLPAHKIEEVRRY